MALMELLGEWQVVNEVGALQDLIARTAEGGITAGTAAAGHAVSEILISMVHAIDMLGPEPAFAFQGAAMIDSLFRRCSPEGRMAVLNDLTDSPTFMQGVSNIIQTLTASVLQGVRSHDPTFLEVLDAPPGAAGAKDLHGSFTTEAPPKPLVAADIMPHSRLVAVQAVGQWMWAVVWLVDENGERAGDVTRAFPPPATAAAVKLLVMPGLPANVRDDRVVPLLERLVRSAPQAAHQVHFVRGLLGDAYTLHCLTSGPTEGLPGMDLMSTKAWVLELLQACVTKDELAAGEYVARGGVAAAGAIVAKYILNRKRSTQLEPDICGRVCAHTASTISTLAKSPGLQALAFGEAPEAVVAAVTLAKNMLSTCIRIRHPEGIQFSLALAGDLLLLQDLSVVPTAVDMLDLHHDAARAAHWYGYHRRGEAGGKRLALAAAVFFKNMALSPAATTRLSPLVTIAMTELMLCEGEAATEAGAAITRFRDASPANQAMVSTVRMVESTRPGCLFWMDDMGLSCAVASRRVASAPWVFRGMLGALLLLVILAVLGIAYAYLAAFGMV